MIDEHLTAAAETAWDSELSDLLSSLSATQEDLLSHLADKRRCLVTADVEGLAALQAQEEQLIGRLERCHERRGELLRRAADDGLAADSLRSLSASLPGDSRRRWQAPFDQAHSKTRLLAHHSLANWVLVQRTLLHLAQLLEILATGGRLQPTYGRDGGLPGTGGLLDQAI